MQTEPNDLIRNLADRLVRKIDRMVLETPASHDLAQLQALARTLREQVGGK